mmetsp:Transcript_47666/g.96191  ORF Transcript_47666/g.96191 Transcript_47666/m.96191 type:complete len:214 (+) Transcript_47666:54-695(+)
MRSPAPHPLGPPEASGRLPATDRSQAWWSAQGRSSALLRQAGRHAAVRGLGHLDLAHDVDVLQGVGLRLHLADAVDGLQALEELLLRLEVQVRPVVEALHGELDDELEVFALRVDDALHGLLVGVDLAVHDRVGARLPADPLADVGEDLDLQLVDQLNAGLEGGHVVVLGPLASPLARNAVELDAWRDLGLALRRHGCTGLENRRTALPRDGR